VSLFKHFSEERGIGKHKPRTKTPNDGRSKNDQPHVRKIKGKYYARVRYKIDVIAAESGESNTHEENAR
jgi:hypothetical protein